MILVDALIVVAILAIPIGLAVACMSFIKRRQRRGRLRGFLVDPSPLERDDTAQTPTGGTDSLSDPPLPDAREPEEVSHSAQVAFAILGGLLLIVSMVLAVASLRSPIDASSSYPYAEFADVRTTVCVALCFAAAAVLVAATAAVRRRRPSVRAAAIATLVAGGLSASAVAASAGMLQSEMFTGVAHERALQSFWVFIAALPFAGIGILDRPEAERREQPTWAHPVLRGIGLAAALFAASCAALTLSALSAATSARGAWQIMLALVAYALVSAIVTAVGMTERVRTRSQDTTLPWVFGSVLALCSIPLVLSFANLLSPYVPVLQRLDSRPIALFAVLGATAGAVATLCLAFYTNPSFPKEDPYPDHSRRHVVAVGIAFFLVATLGAGLLATSPAVQPPEVSPLAQPVPIPPVPTTIGPTAFMLQLPERPDRITVRAGGPGFVVSTKAGITAHDGTTGALRWRLDSSTLGGEMDRGRDFTVFGTGPDAVVVVVTRQIAIGLDAMTGRLRWKSADTALRDLTRHGRGPAKDRPKQRPRAEIAGGTLEDVRHLGGDLFAAVYKRRYPHPNDGKPTPHVVVVLDGTNGVEVDRFDAVGDLGPMRHGLIPVVPPYHKPGDEILIRDTATRQFIRVPAPASRVSWKDGFAGGFYDRKEVMGWLGDTLMVGELRRILLVNPQKRTVTIRDSPCTHGPLLQATAAPGSMLFTCLREESYLATSDDTTEIVGTR